MVLSETQQNPLLFYFNSSNSTMELLIKYLRLLVKKPTADVRRFSLTREEFSREAWRADRKGSVL